MTNRRTVKCLWIVSQHHKFPEKQLLCECHTTSQPVTPFQKYHFFLEIGFSFFFFRTHVLDNFSFFFFSSATYKPGCKRETKKEIGLCTHHCVHVDMGTHAWTRVCEIGFCCFVKCISTVISLFTFCRDSFRRSVSRSLMPYGIRKPHGAQGLGASESQHTMLDRLSICVQDKSFEGLSTSRLFHINFL